MSRGNSAHVLADDPDRLHFDVVQLGEETVATAHAPARITRITRTPAAPAARATSSTPAQPSAQPARAPRAVMVGAGSEQERMRAAFDAAVLADPITKPVAADLHRELGLTCDKATSRRWVQRWWDEHEAELGTARPEPETPAAGDDDQGDEKAAS
jgi:hypothetical protein